MPTSSRISHRNKSARNQRLTGPASNILLLGFLAGLLYGHAIPTATMTVATSITVFGLALSLVVTKVSNTVRNHLVRKANHRAVAELERRMERLIPKRRVIAHGTHSHSPHNREELEHDWIPVARRGRTVRIHK